MIVVFLTVAYISYILNQKMSNSAILIVLQNSTFFDIYIIYINPYYTNHLYKFYSSQPLALLQVYLLKLHLIF